MESVSKRTIPGSGERGGPPGLRSACGLERAAFAGHRHGRGRVRAAQRSRVDPGACPGPGPPPSVAARGSTSPPEDGAPDPRRGTGPLSRPARVRLLSAPCAQPLDLQRLLGHETLEARVFRFEALPRARLL